MNLFLRVGDKNNSCIRETQENSIEIPLQSSLPYILLLLWQSLVTKTNNYTCGKSLSMDIKWEVHKRTRQRVSAKLESYIY